jgi:hypothetical protein
LPNQLEQLPKVAPMPDGGLPSLFPVLTAVKKSVQRKQSKRKVYPPEAPPRKSAKKPNAEQEGQRERRILPFVPKVFLGKHFSQTAQA